MLFLIVLVYSPYLYGNISWAIERTSNINATKPDYADLINDWALPVFMIIDTLVLGYALIRIRL